MTPARTPLPLRAHHLLCLLTYAGKGYSPAFVGNFDRVVRRLASGEEARLVWGPDAVCAPLCAEEGCNAHCHDTGVRLRDQRAALALAPHVGAALQEGRRLALDAPLVARLRAAFAQGALRSACEGCPWFDLCSGIAARGFAGVRLHPPQAVAIGIEIP